MRKRFDNLPIKKFILDIAGETYETDRDALEGFCSRLVEADLGRLNEMRWKRYKNDPTGVEWADWRPGDVRRRLRERLEAVAANRELAERLTRGQGKGAILASAGRRILRVAVAGGAGYLAALATTGNPTLAIGGALLAVGGEKATRETVRAAGGRGSWIGLILDLFDRIKNFVEARKENGKI